MRIIIVGAGIGGLTTALRLHHMGIDCAVYEQSDLVRELGVGINALPHAVKDLTELGLLERLDQAAVRTHELVYLHRLGQEIMRRPCGLAAGFVLPQFSVHRGRLQGVLLDAVRERRVPVHTGRRLIGFEQDAGGVEARFAGGEPVRGDALVAADGIHSAVRAAMFPDEGAPRWNGVLMWRGATEWPRFGDGHLMVISGGTAAKTVIYPIAPGRTPDTRLTNWAICVRTGRPGDPPPQRQDWSRRVDPATLTGMIERFRMPHTDLAGLVAATADVYEFPMCDRDPLPFWTQGRVTLLGDAAHPMYPMGSNGAGQAILDARSLSLHLAARDDPADALKAYEHERLPATGEIVRRNRAGGPENVIDEVERRAPQGFSRLEDVIDPAELEATVASYAQAAGSSRDQVNR